MKMVEFTTDYGQSVFIDIHDIESLNETGMILGEPIIKLWMKSGRNYTVRYDPEKLVKECNQFNNEVYTALRLHNHYPR